MLTPLALKCRRSERFQWYIMSQQSDPNPANIIRSTLESKYYYLYHPGLICTRPHKRALPPSTTLIFLQCFIFLRPLIWLRKLVRRNQWSWLSTRQKGSICGTRIAVAKQWCCHPLCKEKAFRRTHSDKLPSPTLWSASAAFPVSPWLLKRRDYHLFRIVVGDGFTLLQTK